MAPARDDEARAQARAFLAAFLRGEQLAQATSELEEDVGYWGDQDEVEVLRAARSVLHTHAKVSRDAELSALLIDLELDPVTTGEILGIAGSDVAEIARREGFADLVDLSAVPTPAIARGVTVAAGGTPSPRPSSGAPPADGVASPAADRPRPADVGTSSPVPAARGAQILVGLLLTIVAAIVLATLTAGPETDDPDGALVITDARMTEFVNQANEPGPARERFEVGETPRLWLTYRVIDTSVRTVDLSWWRESADGDEALYPIAVPLVDGREGALNAALAGLYLDDPGDYRVEVAVGDATLLVQRFSIVPPAG